MLATLHVATLPRSLECLPRYMLLRCRDLWNACHVTCCYAPEISGMLATLHVAMLPRSLECLPRYMLLRCRELWNACHVTCCYAAEISGMLATLHVATLPRSLECLPRYMLLRCRELWNACHVTCCYAPEISGMLATLHVATLPRSLECLPRYMLLRCRDLWNACHVTCCYAPEISGMLATLHVATLPRALECLPRYMLLRCRELWNACHVICCYAAWTSCKQFIPKALGVRHKDLILYAKMWQWRFVQEPAPEDCRHVCTSSNEKNASFCPIEMKHKFVFYCGKKQHFPKKHPNLDVQICHFFNDTNRYLAVVKQTFFWKTLFSWARFSIRRDVYDQVSRMGRSGRPWSKAQIPSRIHQSNINMILCRFNMISSYSEDSLFVYIHNNSNSNSNANNSSSNSNDNRNSNTNTNSNSNTSSTAQGGGGSFKNRKPIEEIACCESGMAERIHWWTERCLRSPLFPSLSLTIYLPTSLSSMYLSIYRSIALFLSFI